MGLVPLAQDHGVSGMVVPSGYAKHQDNKRKKELLQKTSRSWNNEVG